ncbi:MAG: DUF4783 domain-containing protein [Bacteroidota bacterium]|nr:DUF4783 domain-containing protein [Bacteroidota bacterium]
MERMIRLFTMLLLALFFGMTLLLFSQEEDALISKKKSETDQAIKYKTTMINDVTNGILINDMRMFSKYFAKQVYVSLNRDESSVYSSNQTLYILQNYFSSRRIVNFEFSKINISELTSYAIGEGTVKFRGIQESINIYLTISKKDGNYVITQIKVY